VQRQALGADVVEQIGIIVVVPGSTTMALGKRGKELLRVEVPFRKRTAGSGLEVLLEAHSARLVGKLERDDDTPGSITNGVSAGTAIVPVQAFVDIARDTDVVARRIAFAAQNVDEPLPGAEHRRAEWQVSRQQET